MSNSGLPQYLSQSQSDGEFDSTADFTVNQAKALAKLGADQLEVTDYWILKIVQYTNQIEADRVDIKLNRSSLEICIHTDKPEDPASLLERAVTSTTNEPVAVAIRVLSNLEGCHFLLRTQKAGESVQVVGANSEEDKLSNLSIQTECENALYLVVAWKSSSYWGAFRANIKRNRTLTTLIKERCWMSCVTVALDGVELALRYSDHFGPKQKPQPETMKLPAMGMFQAPLPPILDRPLMNAPAPRTEGWEALNGTWIWEAFQREEQYKHQERIYARFRDGRETGAHLSVLCSPVSMVQFLCLGVLIDYHVLNLEAPADSVFFGIHGLRVTLPVENSETDLGGMKVRQGAQLAERAFLSAIPYADQLGYMYQCRPVRNLHSAGTEESWNRFKTMCALIGGGFGLSALGLGVFPVLAASATGLTIGNYFPDINKKLFFSLLRPGLKFQRVIMEGLLKKQQDLLQAGVEPFCFQLDSAVVRKEGWEHWRDSATMTDGEWAVKLVQFGVGAGADSIQYFFCADSVKIVWHGLASLPAAENIDFEEHVYLRDALACLARLELESLELTWATSALTWTKESASISERVLDKTTQLIARLKKPGGKTLADSIRNRFRGQVRPWLAATSRIWEECWWSPVPVSVDSVQIPERFAETPRGWRETFQAHHQWRLPLCLCCVELPVQSDSEPELMRPIAMENQVVAEGNKVNLPATLIKRELVGPLSAIFTITAGLRADSAIEKIKDGASVETRALYLRKYFRDRDKEVEKDYDRLALRVFVPQQLDEQGTRSILASVGSILKEMEPELRQAIKELNFTVSRNAVKDKGPNVGGLFNFETGTKTTWGRSKKRKVLLEELDSLTLFPDEIIVDCFKPR